MCVCIYIYIYIFLQCIGNSKEVVHYFNESLDNNLRITRDTCSKDLFEMYRALNLLKICIRGRNAYVEEVPTWKNSLKYAYVEI